MRIKFRSNKDLARCKPQPDRQVDYFDATFPAFGLRVGATGARSWIISYRKAGSGYPTRLTIGKPPGMDLDTARDVARRYMALAELGADLKTVKRRLQELRKEGDRRDGAAMLEGAAGRAGDGAEALAFLDGELRGRQEENKLTFKVARRRYLREYAEAHTKENSYKGCAGILNSPDFKDWLDRPLAALSKQEVREFLKGVGERRGLKRANNYRVALRGMLNWCLSEDLIERSPLAGIKALTRTTSRDRVLIDRELGQIWNALVPGDVFNDLLRVALLTGKRIGEVTNMRWSQLDLDKAEWRLSGADEKNRIPHVVPLAPKVLEIIRRRPRLKSSELVITAGGKPFHNRGQRKKALDERCGVTGWTIHDFRTAFATWANENEICGPHIVEAVLNHVSGRTVATAGVAATYNRATYLRQRRTVLEQWTAHILACARRYGPGGQQNPAPVQAEELPSNVIQLFG